MIYQPLWPAHSPLADAHDDDVLSSHQNTHLSSYYSYRVPYPSPVFFSLMDTQAEKQHQKVHADDDFFCLLGFAWLHFYACFFDPGLSCKKRKLKTRLLNYFQYLLLLYFFITMFISATEEDVSFRGLRR